MITSHLLIRVNLVVTSGNRSTKEFKIKKSIKVETCLIFFFKGKNINFLYSTGFCEFQTAVPGKQARQHCWSHPVMFPNGLVSAWGHSVVESSYSCQGSALQFFPPHFFFLSLDWGRKNESICYKPPSICLNLTLLTCNSWLLKFLALSFPQQYWFSLWTKIQFKG